MDIRVSEDPRRRFSTRVLIPGGACQAIEFGFEADNITVMPDQPLSARANVYLNSYSGTPMPLEGTGSVQTSWEAWRVYIENTGATARGFFVFASRGYAPLSIVRPVTEAAPMSAEVQSVTLYYASGTSSIFTHEHAADGRIILLYHLSAGQNTNPYLTSVKANGASQTILIRTQYTSGTSQTAHNIAIARTTELPAGNVVIESTSSSSARHHIFALSFDPGVVTGNVAANTKVNANLTISVPAQYDTSSVLAIYAADQAQTEKTGATLILEHHETYYKTQVWRKDGRGTQTFSFNALGTNRIVSVGLVELFPQPQ